MSNHEEENLQKILKIQPFISKYIWETVNYPSENNDWKKFEKNNLMIDINVFYILKSKKYKKTSYYFNEFKRRRVTSSKHKT